MAAPFIAAIYALLMEVRRTKDPKTLENLLSSTSKPNLFNDGHTTSPFLAPAVQQGTGLVQAYDAAYTTALLSVSSLSFNDTDNFVPVQNFTISNIGDVSVVYTLSHVGAATGYALPRVYGFLQDRVQVKLTSNHATMEFSNGGSFELPAGHSKVVSVTATPPVGLDPKKLPVYPGYIVINGTDNSNLSLPYVGVVGSSRSAIVLDNA